MKNFSIALVLASSLAVSLSAFAAKGAPYQAPAAEPELARFTLTGGATYLLPSLNGLDYLSVESQNPLSTTSYRLEPGYDFGYFLGFGYLISDRYDVQATWSQFDSESSDSLLLDGNSGPYNITTSNNAPIGVDGSALLYTEAQESLNFQAFDATLGQYHTLADNLMTRVFIGVRYAKVDNKSVNDYSYNNVDVVTGFESYDSTFSGAGPEVGLDMNYSVIDWFGVVGHFAGAFLIGQQETQSNLLSDLNPGNLEQNLTYSDNGTIMVPAIDAKLGVNLGVPFMDLQDRFMIEAGYQVAYYFNVVDQVQSRKADTEHNVSDVGMMGPYMNLGFKF